MTELLERVAADVAARVARAPEGVSILIAINEREAEYLESVESVAIEVARELARRQHPDVTLTGRVLWVGLDELGPGLHEVVLEVD